MQKRTFETINWKDTAWYEAIVARRTLARRMLTENPSIATSELAKILQCSRTAAYNWKKRMKLGVE